MEFDKFNTVIEVNGQKLEVQVCVTVEEDYDSGPDMGDWEDDTPMDQHFFGHILVEATALGLTGFDSLSGVSLRANNMSDSKPFESDVKEAIREHGLLEQALGELRSEISQKHAELTQKAQEFRKYASS